MTPRKPRQKQHQRQPSALVQASDYESEAQVYADAHVPPPPSRTNPELNLSVLRRYNPAIRSIISIAANAVAYTFSSTSQGWEKMGVEGTLFVCEQESYTGSQREFGFCVVVLNRRELNNVMVDLTMAANVEVTPELLILNFATSQDTEQKVMGLWIHADRASTRDENAKLIKQCWESLHQS